MSQLISPKYTVVYNIPLVRRISEVLKEKGEAFSQTVVSRHLGINRETLRLKLKGVSELYNFELEKILRFINVSFDRIMLNDIIGDVHYLSETNNNKEFAAESLQIALKLNEVAIGISEKCNSKFLLGQAYKNMNLYEEAHNAWLDAYEYAIQIEQKYGENDILYMILRNLITTYTHRNDFTKAIELIRNVEPVLESTPLRSASLSYSQAKIYEHLGDIRNAREVSIKSLDYCLKSGNRNSIARAKINVAHYEYKLLNYSESKKYLEEAVAELSHDKETKLIAMKDLSKTLIWLGEIESVLNIIESALEEINNYRDDFLTNLEGRFLIIRSRAVRETVDAERVLQGCGYGNAVRHAACKYLIKYYKDLDDEANFLKYSKMKTDFFVKESDILEGDDL